MILEELAQLGSPDLQRAFKIDFKEEFKVGLSDLPASKHGQALAWTRAWLNKPAEGSLDDPAPAEATT